MGTTLKLFAICFMIIGRLLFHPVSCTAFDKSTIPQVKNFTKRQYKASSQNWSVAQDRGGHIYVANSVGLLEFDGSSWKLYPSPNGNIIRAVAVDSLNRIFTSGYQELGYWTRDQFGQLHYSSLKEKAKSFFNPNVEFWDIFISGEKVFFYAFTQLLVFENETIKAFNFDSFTNYCTLINGKLLFNEINGGIFEFDNFSAKPFIQHPLLNEKNVRFILPHGKEQYLIGTASHGIFKMNEGALEEWDTPLNDYFRKNQINRGSVTPRGELLIGTILDGISLLDKNGQLLWKLNSENGLQNNTVLGITIDSEQNIWLALDRGIDLIAYQKDPGHMLFSTSNTGAVYSAAHYNGKIYIGTNQGLYFRNQSTPQATFQLVPETQGQVWDIKTISGSLVVGQNSGTFLITGEKVKRISNVSGAFSIVNDPLAPEHYFQCTYSNIVRYRQTADGFQQTGSIQNFNDLIRFIEFDHRGNLWASHFHRGIFKIKLNESKDSVVSIRHYGENSIFQKDNNINVFKIENRVVFTTGNKLFTYDDLADTIIDYHLLNEKLGEYAAATRIIPAPNHQYWFITKHFIGLFSINGTEIAKLREFPCELFEGQFIQGFENLIPLDNDQAILCLENGFAYLGTPHWEDNRSLSQKTPSPRQIVLIDKNGKNYPHPFGIDFLKIPSNQNNLKIRFAIAHFSTDKITFSWFLQGLSPEWSASDDSPELSFERLPKGKYTLKVKATDTWGNESKVFTLPVIVLPPWYWSKLAKILYLLLSIGALALFRNIIIVQTRKKEKRKREDKEREFIRLKNEKLKNEVLFKSKELANSTMSIIKKNEFLLDMKHILKSQKNQLGTRYPDKYYNDLMKKIDDNISSQDDWQIFETNFEQAHEEFTKNLKNRFPELTPSDLRLCAFLRMNLSSKEIAPLLGISVRGVENHRYRLRKKMELRHDENLTELIINL